MGREKKTRNRQKKGVSPILGAMDIREHASLKASVEAARAEGRKEGIQDCLIYLMEECNKLTRRVADYECNFDANKYPAVGLDVETLENNIGFLNILIRELNKL